MAFRLISSGGSVSDPAVVDMRCSGVIRPGAIVDFSRTAGQGVIPGGMASSITTIFGVALEYAQGASDKQVRVIPFEPGQLWEADCVNVATTAQIGLRHGITTSGGITGDDRGLYIHNTASDVTLATAIFRCVGIANTTGSGKIIGYFRRGDNTGAGTLLPTDDTTGY